MTQVIVFKNEKGGVSLCIPTGELPIEEVQKKDAPEDSIIMNRSDIPFEHNDFFDAWELVDGVVVVNLEKAKEITKDRLRSEREPLLQTQDVAFQRALESGADTSAIVAEKQRLRDLPTLANSAKTLDELRSLKA